MAKIYTRQGDQGQTSILGGTRLPKSHSRLHAYGTIDELNAHLGTLMFYLKGTQQEPLQKIILRLQNELFVAGGLLACDDVSWLKKLPQLSPSFIDQMEAEIDLWADSLPKLQNFILPGGSAAALAAHHARTVCRRAERWTSDVLQGASPDFQGEYQLILMYLNRLSDHLFTLSRWLNFQDQIPETPWIPS